MNNIIIKSKPDIILEHKEKLLKSEKELYDYEEYEIVKHKSKDDLVL